MDLSDMLKRSAAGEDATLPSRSQSEPPTSTAPPISQAKKRKRTPTENSASGEKNTSILAAENDTAEPSTITERRTSARLKLTAPKKVDIPKAPAGTSKKKPAGTRKLATPKRPQLRNSGSKKATRKTNARPKQTKKPQKLVIKSPAPLAPNELPHNLGTLEALIPSTDNFAVPTSGSDKENRDQGKSKTETGQEVIETNTKPAETKTKSSNYRLSPGKTPFPKHKHPTPKECEEVNSLLTEAHGPFIAPKIVPEPSLTVTGCGEVPCVLDALIRTLLSGATTSANSARAFNGLVQKFGILKEGIGKGSVDWDAVRRAPLEDVFQAMKSGGLASIKSKSLKAILDMVYKENQERRNVSLEGEPVSPEKDNIGPVSDKAPEDRLYAIACADQHVLSLNHLHKLTKEEAMTELTKYPGIGPKTAACVILFCLQRPCFAVDTHIFRITKWLGWLPSTCTSEVTAFSHLEVRIPDHLKYSLHQLFIRHGRSCPRCRAITGETSAGWEEGCVIEDLVKRTGVRKPAGPPPKKRKKKAQKTGGGKQKKQAAKQSSKKKVSPKSETKKKSRSKSKREQSKEQSSQQQDETRDGNLESGGSPNHELPLRRVQPKRGTKLVNYLEKEELERDSQDNDVSMHFNSEIQDSVDTDYDDDDR